MAVKRTVAITMVGFILVFGVLAIYLNPGLRRAHGYRSRTGIFLLLSDVKKEIWGNHRGSGRFFPDSVRACYGPYGRGGVPYKGVKR